jgi:cAMP-specific phosphodiesterase 4/calcium/calmodulin-dependent 3',5'-cyclic nucleotide phosphodiesterase
MALKSTDAGLVVGDQIQYVGGGRFSGNQVFTGLWELRIGDTGVIHAIPGEKGEFGCSFGNLKVSLNKADLRTLLPLLRSQSSGSPRKEQALTAALLSAKTRAKSTSYASPRPTPQRASSQASRSKTPRSGGLGLSASPFVSNIHRHVAAAKDLRSKGKDSQNKQMLARLAAPGAASSSMLPEIPATMPASIDEPSTSQATGRPEQDEMEPMAESERPHPPSFYCPISHQCMHDPVILTDGHTYERRHIEHWLKSNETSPVSGAKLSHKVVVPNHAMRNAIEEYFTQVLGDHRQAIKQAICGLQRRNFSSCNTNLIATIDSLMQCSILVNADLSIEHVLTKIMQEAKCLLGAEVASVFLVDRRKNELYSTVNSTGGELRIPMKSGIAGSVAYSGIPVIIEDAYCDARFNSEVDSKTGFKTRSILCVPIKAWKGAIIGVAQLINKTESGVVSSENQDSQRDAFTSDDQQFFEVLAAQAGAAIVNSGMFESMPGVSGAGRWPSPPKARTPSLGELPPLSRSSTMEFIPETMSRTSTMQEVPARCKPITCSDEEEGLSPKKAKLVKPLLTAAAEDWEMDTLSLAELTNNKPLSTLGKHLFGHHELLSFFGIDSDKLEKFLLVIERGYPKENQYHNRSHAASVLHCMHCLLSLGGLSKATAIAADAVEQDRREKLVILGGLVAAIVHDFEHEGVNNDFLVKSASEKAILYNDRSPNENHHVAAAWFVLQRPECNFLENLTVKEYRTVRSIIVDMVLATDMAGHGNTLKKFKEMVGSGGAAKDADSMSIGSFSPTSKEEALTVLQLALKCADLGHLSLGWSSHMRWVQRLEEEFFTQGDREAKLGMPEKSFLMDREKDGASETQIGFFDFVVLPLFRELTGSFPLAQPMCSAVESNYQKWKEIKEAPREIPVAPRSKEFLLKLPEPETCA